MYICLCHAITERQIAKAAELGARCPADLAQELGIGTGCGRCIPCAEAVLCETLAGMAIDAEPQAA